MDRHLRPASLIFAVIFFALIGAASAVEIPFKLRNGFICLEARVEQRREPLHLLLDSGAGTSVFSLRTAQEMGLKFGPAQPVRGIHTRAAAYPISALRPTTGGVVLPGMALAVDLTVADRLCRRRVDGLIGADFFADRVVQIDYARRRLRLLPPGSASGAGERLPLRIHNRIACVPVAVNGVPGWVRLDTGCGDALHWVAPGIGAMTSGGRVGHISDPRDAVRATVTLGAQPIPKVRTFLHGTALFPGEAGLLGHGLLSQFLVTVDWPKRQLVLGPRR
jgi:hypothetical protein